MSLFPAYSNDASTSQNVDDLASSTSSTGHQRHWLSNPSFQMPPSEKADDIIEAMSVDSHDETSNDSTSKKSKKHSKKKKKKEHKHKKDKRSVRSKSDSEPKLEFTGKEAYFVDKKPNNSYISLSTLKKEEHPRYRCPTQLLGTRNSSFFYSKDKPEMKRYFDTKIKSSKVIMFDSTTVEERLANKIFRLDEEQFTEKTKGFNRSLLNDNKDIPMWLDFVRLQNNFYLKMTKIQLAERKMDILNRALRENPANDVLYREYIDILEQTYPSFEVSKFLDILLQKDSANYLLWNAQIMATQGSMARCRIPDVLELYEKCMKNMYKKNRCDEVTLRLFSSCALFLRQSGLNEQFFALITLALELNVSENKFSEIKPNEDDHNTLIEYEEIVLKSGLPMNEIWLRIEKLRQNYYFLPVPGDRTCSDPQRIVLNEDILHYIYPLSNREYAFNLVIVILRLLKIPLVDNVCLKSNVFSSYEATNCDNLCDFDCIEEISAIFLTKTILNDDKSFDDILWTMIRDFSIGPSFITTHIGHELYVKYLSEVLLLCADSFTQNSSSNSTFKRNLFILLLLRLERIILAFDLYKNKWNDDKTKRLRNKIKNLLKRNENRNCLIFYVEYARIECTLNRFQQSENIFKTAIEQCNPLTDDDCTRSEYWYAYISYVEMLMLHQKLVDALKALTSLAFDQKIDHEENYGEATYLLASKKLNERMKNMCAIERNVSYMDVIQSFKPDYLINVIKANVYHLLMWRRNKNEVCQQMEILLKSFPEKNLRHKFIREQIYELYINILNYEMNTSQKTLKSTLDNRANIKIINRAVDEFPTNMVILKYAAMCDTQPWYKIRAVLTRQQSPIAIIFLIAAAQWRYKRHISPLQSQGNSSKTDGDFMIPNVLDIENAYKIRVTNLLRTVTDYNAPTKKNSLLWRLYLRSLLDVTNDFEKSRNLLLTALNECPWNKALYLDGTVYVPQELAHLQDLIIEKQLRIYAMPEELEILRNFDEPQ